MRSKVVKLLSLVLSLSIMIAAVTSLHIASASTASEIRQQIAEYEEEQKQIENKIDSLEKSKAEYTDIQAALNKKISNLQDQIDLYNSRIYEIQCKIDSNNIKIEQKEQEVEDAKEQLKQRLRAIYVAGSYSELAVLLSAEDYGDFLARTELMRGVTEHDTALMDNLNAEIKEIDRLNEENEAIMAENKELKADVVAKQEQLDREYSQAQAKLDSISASQNELQSDADDLQAEIEEKEAELSEIVAAIKKAQTSSNRVYSGSGFAWPFQSSYYISCSYGQQSYRFHTGVDITCGGAYGKPIYAAADGTVISAVWSNRSYGNHISIDHGSGIATLYAHCSSLLVSSGETVKKGQLIAYCGSTGNSSGPHLHFEVRVNGQHTNPMNYSYSTGF